MIEFVAKGGPGSGPHPGNGPKTPDDHMKAVSQAHQRETQAASRLKQYQADHGHEGGWFNTQEYKDRADEHRSAVRNRQKVERNARAFVSQHKIGKTAAQHSGVMVALMIPPEIGKYLAVKGGEPVEKLHVTICYIPKIANDKKKIVALQEALAPLSKSIGPITGRVGGYGRFEASDSSDGKDVLYASFSSPGLEALRRAVLKCVEDAGLTASNAHGYTPHITLAYVDPEEKMPKKMKTTLPFPIDKLTIGIGDEYIDFQTSGTIVLKGDLTRSSVHTDTTDWTIKFVKTALEHDPENLKQLKDSFEQFIDEEGVEKDGSPRVPTGGGAGPSGVDQQQSNSDGIYSMAQVVSGIDWELGDGGLSDVDDAREKAVNNLSDDPDFYRKKRLELANSPSLTMKDTDQTETDALEGVGVNLDLGSGQSRENGYLGVDLYPFDHGTIVHDLEMGLPFMDDESCENVRMSNVPDVDPKILMSEIQRVLMPGGQFTYEGPSEIENYPPYMKETAKEQVDKEAESQPRWTKQSFTRLAMPDAATSNDAEPRIGIAQYDALPADALLAMDATGYYNSDGTSSGRGNRVHGYPSQGALLNKEKIPGVEYLGEDNTGAVSKSRYCPIVKADNWKKIVYCVVLSPDETDLQADIMDEDEIEKTAHDYLLNARVIGSGHSKAIDAGVVESYIAPQDFETNGQLGPQVVKKGAWVIAIKVQDPKEWQKVLNGEYTGVSVGGFGSRTPV